MRTAGSYCARCDLPFRTRIHGPHAHPGDAGTMALYECAFPYSTPVQEMLQKVKDCAAKSDPGQWIRGGQWAAELLTSSEVPNRSMLDAAAPNNPVFLIDSTVHVAWVNSSALGLLNIDKQSSDPEGGVIVRNTETGEATGILMDNATYNAMRKLPAYSVDQMEQALAWSVCLRVCESGFF